MNPTTTDVRHRARRLWRRPVTQADLADPRASSCPGGQTDLMPAPVVFRRATRGDLDSMVALLADDQLGLQRESSSARRYESAFDEIDADSCHLLVVGELDDKVVACLQATVLPCLTHGGRRRAHVEGVRVHGSLRGEGVGRKMLHWTIEWARAEGCGVIQLSTDKQRPDALRFYETLGFVATHEGLKLLLDGSA